MADSFNNPPQRNPTQSTAQSHTSHSNNAMSSTAARDPGDSSHVPRPKRIACVVCRRRKLKCDGTRPSCGTCSRLGHECSYDEVRKKSGPRRGYVKQLEARLAQVETLLNKNDQPETWTSATASHEDGLNATASNAPTSIPNLPTLPTDMDDITPPLPATFEQSRPNENYLAGDVQMWNDYQWDMVSLGLEEPLPTQEAIDELDRIYFEKIHPSVPFIHRPTYFSAMNLGPNARPPVCLRYIMWCHAAVVTDKYINLHPHFYQRARKYAEMDEIKGLGERVINLRYCQAWILIAMYEFKTTSFPRSWLSAGKAVRLAQMMGLHRLDGAGLDVKMTLMPARNWTEKEERRRVFWMAFCIDRCASVGAGWPMTIDERDIMTDLPAFEEPFLKSKKQQASRLADVMSGEAIGGLSPFAAVVVLTCFFGRNLVHLHRPSPQDNDNDLNGEFWKRHRAYENLLLHTALSMPDHLRLPAGIGDPNVIFWNMGLHAAAICLHQASIFTAEKNRMVESIVAESKRRILVAADQITSIMRMISHTDLSLNNQFMPFCVFIAARVFVQHLQARPEESSIRSSLEFLVSALNVLKNRNALTAAFLLQLEVDLEGLGLRSIGNSGPQQQRVVLPQPNIDTVECSPLFTIRQSQSSVSVVGNPSQDSTRTSQQTNDLAASFLPCRGKPNVTPQSNINATSAPGNMGGFTNSPNDVSQGIGEANGQRSGTEMDFSDLSPGDMVTASDHPTPSTLNSTNTSYSMARTGDQPSISKSQQPQQPFTHNNHHPPQNPISTMPNTMDIPHPSQFGDIPSLTPQHFYTTAGGSEMPIATGSTATEVPFSMPPTTSWDVGDLQNSQVDNAHHMPELSEAQIEQMLSGQGLGSWGW